MAKEYDTEPRNPAIGELCLRKQNPRKEGSKKITYRVYQFRKGGAMKRATWRMTLLRVEWFPNKLTWRLIHTVAAKKPTGTTWWKQNILADYGQITESEACGLALATLSLLGY